MTNTENLKVRQALEGRKIRIKRSSTNTYDGTDVPYVFVRIVEGDPFEGETYLVLSHTAAVAFEGKPAEERANFLFDTLEVAYNDEDGMWGIHMPDTSITLDEVQL